MSCFAGKNGKLIPGWFWKVFICFPLGLMAWWFLRWFFLPSYKRTSSVEIETPRSFPVRTPIQKDDFQVLKGVGPKTTEALYQAGIFSFEQLALMDSEKLSQLMRGHNLPAGAVKSWQEQAAQFAQENR